MYKIFILLVSVFHLLSCTSSPRYGRVESAPKSKRSTSISSKKTKPKSTAVFIDPKTVNTNVKHKKRMVGMEIRVECFRLEILALKLND